MSEPENGRAGARRAPFGRVVGVSKTFETGDQTVTAVKDVSFDFNKGDLVALLGPSGCGKTTVLKMMGGLIPSSGGLLELDGKAITKPFPGVGVVFQAPTLMPWRSVLANVLFPMEVLGRAHSIAEAIYLSDRVLVFSKRPATIAKELNVDIPYPRSAQSRFLPEFHDLEREAGVALGVVKP